MIKNCIAIDIKEFIAVVGYNKDKVIDLAGKLEKKHDINIKIIENTEYDITNTSGRQNGRASCRERV